MLTSLVFEVFSDVTHAATCAASKTASPASSCVTNPPDIFLNHDIATIIDEWHAWAEIVKAVLE